MKEQSTPQKEISTAGSRISLADAEKRVRLFEKMYMQKVPDEPEYIKANAFSGKLIIAILKQPGCEGIRIYNSVNPDGHNPETGKTGPVRELILIGTDKEGNDLLSTKDYPVEKGRGCNPLSAIIALPASAQGGDALVVANPRPCPNMCGGPNSLNRMG